MEGTVGIDGKVKCKGTLCREKSENYKNYCLPKEECNACYAHDLKKEDGK